MSEASSDEDSVDEEEEARDRLNYKLPCRSKFLDEHFADDPPYYDVNPRPMTLKNVAKWASVPDFFELFERWNKEYQKTYSSDEDKLSNFHKLYKLWYKECYKTRSSEENNFYWLKLLMANYPFKLPNKSYESSVKGSGHPLCFMEIFERWNKEYRTKEEKYKQFLKRRIGRDVIVFHSRTFG
ncbi:uncharacterized protein LOC123917911 isoform X3 [Trifolium pratense]|uniref:uncharacterized protein LOC123917911 isoform X3 n=1 Tax=Trifolium pratense TaxID=57577 RepID=UPI001E694511|nr:uncharacterized protein LOC123917911 isoform X3 [Trifolium pratense]